MHNPDPKRMKVLSPPGDSTGKRSVGAEVEDAKLAFPSLRDLLAQPGVRLAGVAMLACAVTAAAMVWVQADKGPTDRERLRDLQHQIALIEARASGGGAAVAELEGQLAGLSTQLAVLQAQMQQSRQDARAAAGAAPQAALPPIRIELLQGAGGTVTAVPEATGPDTADAPVMAAAVAPSPPPSTENLTRLINDGLRGQDRDSNPVFRQIMLSALDLTTAYAVSLAAWGPEPAPIMDVLVGAKEGDFAFRRVPDGGAMVVPKAAGLERALRDAGGRSMTLDGVEGFAIR